MKKNTAQKNSPVKEAKVLEEIEVVKLEKQHLLMEFRQKEKDFLVLHDKFIELQKENVKLKLQTLESQIAHNNQNKKSVEERLNADRIATIELHEKIKERLGIDKDVKGFGYNPDTYEVVLNS